MNSPDQWEVFEKPDLAIVPQNLWEKVQNMRRGPVNPAVINPGPIPYARPATRPLTGKIKCGECGGTVAMLMGMRYSCVRARERGSCENNRGMGTRHMEKLVIRKLKADLIILKSDKSWLTNMDYLKEREDKIIQELKLELYKLKPKITRIVEAIADGFDTAEMRSKLLLLDQRKKRIKERISNSKIPDLKFSHKETFLKLVEVFEWIEKGLEKKETSPEIVKALNSIVDNITMTPRYNKQVGTNISITPAWTMIMDLIIERLK